MNVLVVADLHGKSGDRGELGMFEQLLVSIEKTMVREHCTVLVVNGDFWDEKHGLVWEVFFLIKKYLLRWAERGWRIIWIRGNHEVDVKTHPERSFIDFFALHEKIEIVSKPRILNFDGHLLCCMPWYLPDPFIKGCKLLAEKVQSWRNVCSAVLLPHVGLLEGNASPSNIYYVNQRVQVQHLHPEVYDYVLCGDYHLQQKLASNVWYIGAPRQMAHGDVAFQEPFLIEYSGRDLELYNVPLEGWENFPQFETFEAQTQKDLDCLHQAILGVVTSDRDLTPQDFVRLRVAPELRGVARQMFPYERWTVDVIPTLRGSVGTGRLADIKENDSEAVLDIWLRGCGLDSDPIYKDTAMKYLIEAVEL